MEIDPELREFAKRTDGSKRSVLVELASSPVAPPRRMGRAFGSSESESEASVATDAATWKALVHALAKLELDEPPTELRAAGTIVAQLTGKQLAAVMDLPMVAAIRRNRTHRVPRDSSR